MYVYMYVWCIQLAPRDTINNISILKKNTTKKIQIWHITSLLMSPCWGTGLPYGLHLRKTGHNPPRGPSAWWVLTTANAAGNNGLTCLPKHEYGTLSLKEKTKQYKISVM
jgi:hypothetical protein